MASPQLENGHTRISNELLDAIVRHPFSGNGLRFALWVIRSSYGWNRKFIKEWSFRKASKELSMPIGSVHLAMQVLIDNEVIIKDESGRLYLNKDYEKWSSVQPTERTNQSKSVQPTERKRSAHRTEAFSPLNGSVQPTERLYGERHLKTVKERKEREIIPPKIELVTAYCIGRNNGIDPNNFIDHYEARGWMLGKTKMKDWQAAIRTWERNNYNNKGPKIIDTYEKLVADSKQC